MAKKWDGFLEGPSIIDARLNILASDLEEIQVILDNMTTRSAYDANYKFIYTCAITKIINNALSPSDYDLLNEIVRDVADSSFANLTAFYWFDVCGEQSYPDYAFSCDSEEPVALLAGSGVEATEKGYVEQVRIVSSVYNDIWVSSPVPGVLRIFDMSGKMVYKRRLEHHLNISEHMSSLPAGAYYYVVSDLVSGHILGSGIIPSIH